VDGPDTDARALLGQGVAARAGGDLDGARAAFATAYDIARRSSDVGVMTEAALGLAAGQMWGTLPGRGPAFLHEAYQLAEGRGRTRLAVALARAWAYAGDPARAMDFAADAVAAAETIADPTLLAEALDAELLVHWGPDDLAERLRITTRLEDVVAHIADVEARLSAHLWRLTTALECLDMIGVQRQLRALDLLADESRSARVRFFAASRRGMYALLQGDTAAAGDLLDEVRRSGAEASEPDAFALEHTLAAGIARQRGERAALVREAEVYEEFGTREGAPSVSAQAAVLWLEAGETHRAETLLHQVAGADFSRLTRDVEWLLTVTSLTEVAAAIGAAELAAAAVTALEPYAGRAVVNAGAVAFEGVVDDYLARACVCLGRTDDAARWRGLAITAYERLNSPWWSAREQPTGTTPSTTAIHLRPAGADIWLVGPVGRTEAVRESKGLVYLRTLLRNPHIMIAALDLSDVAAGHAGSSINEAGRGELIDRRALAEYRRRLAELDAELDQAEDWSDRGQAAALAVERDAILEQLAAATGLGGRQRRSGASAERARVAVRKAIAAAIARIDQVDTATARLLRDTIRTGSLCGYDPDPHRPVSWVLD
jgi:hypothetical protein